ncbi:MAG: sigma-70 family RNA polymerase sigma factor [Minicystis sp.]
MKGYGPEVFRFLLAWSGDEAAASEVFSLFAEGIWRGLGSFDWACSFRTWAFGVARRTSLRHRRDGGRRAAREIPLEHCSAISAIEEQVRSRTLSYLRTERRNRFAELRDALPPDDRALLLLRVDRKLAWNDCARAMHDGEQPLEDEALKREAARLRKRYQLVKEKLLEAGRREGLTGKPANG